MKDQQLTIGKSEFCDVYLGGRYTAVEHARLLVVNDVVSIEDLNSPFGTFVNAEKIDKPRILNPGDKVKIGPQLFDWESYTRGVEVAAHDPNPIYFKDLFTLKGEISKANYRFVLLFAAIAPLLIFFGVPYVLVLLESTRRRNPIDLVYLTEPLWWLFGLLTAYIFGMQSIKRYRTRKLELK